MSRPEQTTASRFTWPQIAALIVGALFFLAGLIGFVPTGLDHFASHGGGATFLGFGVNPLHNIVHIVIGLAGLAAATSLRASRGFGWFLLIAYGAVLIFGLFAVSRPSINFLNLNVADNWLHGVSALVGAGIAAGANSMLGRSATTAGGVSTVTETVDVRDRARLADRYDDRRDSMITDVRDTTTRGRQSTTRGTAPRGADQYPTDPRGTRGAHPSTPGQRMPEHDVPEHLRRGPEQGGYDPRRGGN